MFQVNKAREVIKVKDLKPHSKNPKLHDVKLISKSIENLGFIDDVVIDENNVILGGHGRIKALKELGQEEVEVIRISNWTEEQKEKYLLTANQSTMLGGIDNELLLDFDKDILDFSGFNSDILISEEAKDDDVPEIPKKPISKLGDLYELPTKDGQFHRVLCGDSTSKEDVEKLMGGKKANMAFTDPPYGMKKENDGVANDNLNYDDLLEFNKKWIPITFNNLKDNGSWYCWGIDEPLMDIYSNILKPMAKENKITFRNLITWDKGNGQGQLSSEFRMYPIADEKCLFVMCGVQGFNTNQDNYFEEWEPVRSYLEKEIKKIGESDQKIANALGYKDGRTVNHWWSKSQWAFPTEENFKALQEYAKSKGISIFENVNGIKAEYEKRKAEYEKRKAEYYSTRAYFNNTHDNMNNVWHFSKTSGEERESAGGHATPKPIALCSRAIKSSSRENENVLDVFGGSGSTLIACEQNNRNCYVMELEPKWVDVIIQRYVEYTGNNKIIKNGKEIIWQK